MRAIGACLGTNEVPRLYGGLLLFELCSQLGLGTGGHLNLEAHLGPPDGVALLEVRECVHTGAAAMLLDI